MRALIGLGSNLGDRLASLRRGLSELCGSGARLRQASALYETEPWGSSGGAWFLNAAVEIEAPWDPWKLLARARDVESTLGRSPGLSRNGPRALDLDILALRGCRMRSVRLTLPHPRIWGRDFVLEPLRDLRGLGDYFPEGLPPGRGLPLRRREGTWVPFPLGDPAGAAG